MATAGPLTLSIHFNTEAVVKSLLSVFDVLEASGALRETVAERFPDLFSASLPGGSHDLTLEHADLLFGEAVLVPADGASEVFLHPSERYVELVAAIAGSGNVALDGDLHSWPVLSVGRDSPTVADARAATNCPGRGAA